MEFNIYIYIYLLFYVLFYVLDKLSEIGSFFAAHQSATGTVHENRWWVFRECTPPPPPPHTHTRTPLPISKQHALIKRNAAIGPLGLRQQAYLPKCSYTVPIADT